MGGTAQWAMTLTKCAAPLRKAPVDRIDTEAVLSVLRPIWQANPETASRFRGRIGSIQLTDGMWGPKLVLAIYLFNDSLPVN
jgi:hypothetical protein